jgi:hypothetical protein
VNQRQRRQDVQRILFRDLPMDSRSMARRVPECPEYPLDKVQESCLLATFALRLQRIEGEPRMPLLADGEGLVSQWGTVGGQPRFLAQLVRYALGRLENRVEIVIRKQLGSTEPKDVRVHLTIAKRLPECTGTRLRRTKGPHGLDLS